jgi:hypothetical protein
VVLTVVSLMMQLNQIILVLDEVFAMHLNVGNVLVEKTAVILMILKVKPTKAKNLLIERYRLIT